VGSSQGQQAAIAGAKRVLEFSLYHFSLPEDYRQAAKDRRARQEFFKTSEGDEPSDYCYEHRYVHGVLGGPWRLGD